MKQKTIHHSINVIKMSELLKKVSLHIVLDCDDGRVGVGVTGTIGGGGGGGAGGGATDIGS